jgi:tetratricopeptide (TPR) repeat protein
LAGEGENVKEYLIGLEVFDRQSGYDPGSDPIVRAEARRLRARLAEYYRDFGQHDPVHIELPKGTYVPVFHRNGVTATAGPDESSDDSPIAEAAKDDSAIQLSPANPLADKQSWKPLAIVFVPLLIAIVLFAIHRIRHGGNSGSPETSHVVVLADFTNTTGDAVFDSSLRQALSSQLEQSPFLNLLSDQRIAQTLSLMSQPKDPRLTRELAREVCQRTASSATIDGSIASVGNEFAIKLQAVNCHTGEILADQHVTAAGKSEVLTALARAAAQLRQRLGESLASVQRYDAPPENVTTASLEALHSYSLGTHAMMVQGDYEAAVPHFQRAIGLDPNFAMAYARLGTSYANLNQNERAAENLRQAYALRQRVSDRERFYIDSHYYELVTGDMVATRATYELWNQTYPSDAVAANNLGRTYSTLGDYDKSLAAYQQALKLGPATGLLYGNLVFSYLSVDRLDEARATAQEAQEQHLDSPWIHLYLYWVDFLQHDQAGMAREVANVTGKPGSEDLSLYQQANTAAFGGQLAKAQQLTEQAIASAEHADDKPTAAGYQAIHAVHEALAGNSARAQQQAKSALALSDSTEVKSLAGLALALAGDSEEAMRLADELAKDHPQDTWLQFNAVPCIRAAVALQRGNAAQAIEALAPTAPYELGRGDLIWLYPVYLRGQAYLMARQTTAAAAEFQLILSHPGYVLNEPIGALSHLGLARAYADAGDAAKAGTSYQDFLSLWKDADPDVPTLKQAQAEYAKLH